MGDYSPSLFDCIRAIDKLKTFKDLLRHYTRWAYQMQNLRPLNKLGIRESNLDPLQLTQVIKEEINKLLPVVQWAMALSRISAIVTTREPDINNEDKYVEKKIDIFQNWEYIISKDISNPYNFETIFGNLDRSIGYFEESIKRILIGLLNPLKLIASIFGIPIKILEYMGFKTQHPIYEKITYGLMLIILILITKKLGIFEDFKAIIAVFKQ